MIYCQSSTENTGCLGIFFGGRSWCWCNGKKLCSKKKRDAVKFQQLSQMQTQGALLDDGDEEDNENHGMVSERVRGDISHI